MSLRSVDLRVSLFRLQLDGDALSTIRTVDVREYMQRNFEDTELPTAVVDDHWIDEEAGLESSDRAHWLHAEGRDTHLPHLHRSDLERQPAYERGLALPVSDENNPITHNTTEVVPTSTSPRGTGHGAACMPSSTDNFFHNRPSKEALKQTLNSRKRHKPMPEVDVLDAGRNMACPAPIQIDRTQEEGLTPFPCFPCMMSRTPLHLRHHEWHIKREVNI